MSRGPGRIQQAIAAAFARSPSETFTVEELGPIAYPGLDAIEKRHRVAILRAAYATLESTGWKAFTSEQPGGHILFYNPLDLRSYAVARLRAHFNRYYYETVPQIVARLDDPEDHFHKDIQPGGAWWLHVERRKAAQAGDHKRAAELKKQLDDGTAELLGRLRDTMARL